MNFNPRYFQSYKDRKEGNDKMRYLQEETLNRPPPTGFSSEQRHLQEFAVRNYSRAGDGVTELRLLSVKSRAAPVQQLYAHLTAEHSSGKNRADLKAQPKKESEWFAEAPNEFADDLAATLIQRRYRGRLGKKEFEAHVVEYQRQERSAVRIQCRWRGRAGYSKFLLQRARSYQDDDAAVKLQSILRGTKERKAYLLKKQSLKRRQDEASRIQALYRGRRGRQIASSKARERGNIVASANQWGESDSGLALLLDLGGFKAKYAFSSVRTVAGKPQEPQQNNVSGGDNREKKGFHNSYSVWDGKAVVVGGGGVNEGGLDGEGKDRFTDPALYDLRDGSASLAEQLARIELMAEDLEEDFAKTGEKLDKYKNKFEEDFKRGKEKQVLSRLNMIEYENEMLRLREKKGGRVNVNGSKAHDSGRRIAEKYAAEAAGDAAAEAADDDLKACWSLIHELQQGLTKGQDGRTL